MAQLTFTIPDALLTRIVDGLCQRNGYVATVPNPDFDHQQPEDGQTNPRTIPNPVTKAQFARGVMADWLTEQAIVAETEAEQEQVRITRRATKDSLKAQIT